MLLNAYHENLAPAMMNNTKVSKIDFPHFEGRAVDGSSPKCNQLFELDEVPADLKIQIAVIHLDGPALHWH